MSIAFFVTAAAAAVLGANGYAYDGGASVWLLGKSGRWQVLVAIGAAAAGIVPSVRRPTPTDFDSFRAQPAPVASAMGSLTRSVAVTVAVLVLPLPAAAAVVAAYTALALVHARLVLRDPVALASLT